MFGWMRGGVPGGHAGGAVHGHAGGRPVSFPAFEPRLAMNGGADEHQVMWEALLELKKTVQEDYDHRLSRIESDLRWLKVLVTAQFATIISTAVAVLMGG